MILNRAVMNSLTIGHRAEDSNKNLPCLVIVQNFNGFLVYCTCMGHTIYLCCLLDIHIKHLNGKKKSQLRYRVYVQNCKNKNHASIPFSLKANLKVRPFPNIFLHEMKPRHTVPKPNQYSMPYTFYFQPEIKAWTQALAPYPSP